MDYTGRLHLIITEVQDYETSFTDKFLLLYMEFNLFKYKALHFQQDLNSC